MSGTPFRKNHSFTPGKKIQEFPQLAKGFKAPRMLAQRPGSCRLPKKFRMILNFGIHSHVYMCGVYSARFTIKRIKLNVGSYTNTRWWFQICWFLTPILEGMIWMIHFDVHIFQMGWTTNWNGYCRAFSTWNVFYFPFRMCYRLVQCSGSEKLVGGFKMFQIFFIFTPIWGRFPFWLIFFKGVETTN